MNNAQIEAFPVVLKQAVCWGEMDAFQHVNNIVYYRYFENARIKYFIDAGIHEHLLTHKTGPVIGSSSCQFLKPLTYPDDILIGARVSTVRQKRFTMEYAIQSEKLNEVVATGVAEIIYFDYRTNQTAIIPESILSLIRAIEKG